MVAPVKDPVAQAKFLSKVEMTDTCWIWIPCRDSNVYGSFEFRPAHRASYEIFIGPIPDGKLLRHSCDRKNCVNPDHLTPGTPKENTADYFTRQFVWGPRKKTVYVPVSREDHDAAVPLMKMWRDSVGSKLTHGDIYLAGLQAKREFLARVKALKENPAHA